MGNIGDILRSRPYVEPPEIAAIKAYVFDHFHVEVSVQVRPDVIVIKAPGASLASTLRLNSRELIESCHLDKRLVFRIA